VSAISVLVVLVLVGYQIRHSVSYYCRLRLAMLSAYLAPSGDPISVDLASATHVREVRRLLAKECNVRPRRLILLQGTERLDDDSAPVEGITAGGPISVMIQEQATVEDEDVSQWRLQIIWRSEFQCTHHVEKYTVCILRPSQPKHER